MNDDNKKSKKHAESEDSEADDNDNETKKSTISDNEMFGFMGLIAKSDGKVSANAGTSNKSSGSFRIRLQMGKIEEDIIPSESGDNTSEGERKRERRAKRKVEIKEEAIINEELAAAGTGQGGASLRSFGSEINQLNDRVSSDYELDDLNFNLGTMTIEQDHDSGDESQSLNEKHKLKRTGNFALPID